MYQSLNTRLVQMPDIARRLSRFLTGHDRVWVDRSERIDHDFTSYGLDRVNDDGHGAWVQLLKGLPRERQ